MSLADMATASAAMSMAMLANADVVWGAMECRAIYSKPGVDVLDGMAISDAHSLVYVTEDLPDLIANSSITVNTVAFKTRASRQLDDGLLSAVDLVPA